jgi:hypothetical protein
MDSSIALLRFLFLVAPRRKRCSEKTGDEYHPNNQRPRCVIPKGVNKHDECNHTTAKQNFPMAGHVLKFSHTSRVKPRRICCEKIFTPSQNPRPKNSKNYMSAKVGYAFGFIELFDAFIRHSSIE